mmetsp:Transcript_31917/g.74708  ORF Transcript_31917/g.74708 Transcript_31917/m.74708 type:complete len:225 (-) Transcript_31917:33-707(-)
MISLSSSKPTMKNIPFGSTYLLRSQSSTIRWKRCSSPGNCASAATPVNSIDSFGMSVKNILTAPTSGHLLMRGFRDKQSRPTNRRALMPKVMPAPVPASIKTSTSLRYRNSKSSCTCFSECLTTRIGPNSGVRLPSENLAKWAFLKKAGKLSCSLGVKLSWTYVMRALLALGHIHPSRVFTHASVLGSVSRSTFLSDESADMAFSSSSMAGRRGIAGAEAMINT